MAIFNRCASLENDLVEQCNFTEHEVLNLTIPFDGKVSFHIIIYYLFTISDTLQFRCLDNICFR